ncbi:MAG: hypothetical protein HY982_02350 [Candidatus Magasanikbacteria bacterium]|nr:hypothetical protein [Candidatus Magasanikbacteria bacterium]
MEKWLEWIWFVLDPLVMTATIFAVLVAVIIGFGVFLAWKKPQTLNRLLGIKEPSKPDERREK